MATRGISISVKLISASTILLIAVITLFGVMNRLQSRKLIDEASRRLEQEMTQSLKTAGKAQLALLAEATRITLVQSDYTTLQTIIQNTGRSDERVAAVAVIDPNGTVLAHSAPGRSGSKATGVLQQAAQATAPTVSTHAEGGKRELIFVSPLTVSGSRLCTLFLAYSLASLEAELARNVALRAESDRASLRNTLFLGVIAVLVGVILTIMQGIRLSRPIQALARQADRMAQGDLESRVDVSSRDEIGLLAERFNHMAGQIVVLLRETTAKAAMEKELAVASTIQATLVPEPGLVHLPGLELVGHFKPATHCGGDWWSHFRLTADKTLVVIGDVTGHGVGSAMITAAAQGATSTMLAVTENAVDVRRLLQAMNAAIHATARSKFVMTCFASIFDPATRTLYYGNAGHNFAYHYDAANRKLTALVVRGNRLGDLVTSDYEVRELTVQPGDGIFWYTDGVIECENLHGEEFGEKRFRELVQRNATLSAEQALEGILRECHGFYGGVPQKDDLTLVLAKVV